MNEVYIFVVYLPNIFLTFKLTLNLKENIVPKPGFNLAKYLKLIICS